MKSWKFEEEKKIFIVYERTRRLLNQSIQLTTLSLYYHFYLFILFIPCPWMYYIFGLRPKFKGIALSNVLFYFTLLQ